MENPIDALVEILNQETALYQSMADILKAERRAAVDSRLDGLRAAGEEKSRIVEAIAGLERRRQQLVRTIHREWFGAPGPVAFSDLLGRVDPESAHRLGRCRDRLKATLSQVSALNAENASLLAHSRKWVTGALRLLDHLFNPKTVYRRTGRYAQGGHTGRMLNGSY